MPFGTRARRWTTTHAGEIVFGLLALTVLVLIARNGINEFAQTTWNGLPLGAIYALGAVGLTLVYGILKLVNFAHGDFLTFGAYIAFLVNVTWGLPLALAVLAAMVGVAAISLLFEVTMWRPMRAKGAGLLQLLLMSIGLAFFLRAVIQFIWGTEIRKLDVDTADAFTFLGIQIGKIDLVVVGVGVTVLLLVGLALRYTLLGKQMRAVSDDIDLAETAGINTQRVIFLTWVFSGALAGLAGVLAGVSLNLKPELGFEILLPIFAAVVLGGIGNAFGALTAGLVLGVVIEWSTMEIAPGAKNAVGFLFLVLVLVLRPSGLFGKATSV